MNDVHANAAILQLDLPDPDATEALGQALALTYTQPAVLYLHGDLGAGKSTLARELLRALGVQGAIRSPTYTLVERYPLVGGEAWHLDLYRIGDAGELDFLGLDEAEPALWLIEWPERGQGGLPRADLELLLTADEGTGRQARLVAATPKAQDWLERLQGMSQLQSFFVRHS